MIADIITAIVAIAYSLLTIATYAAIAAGAVILIGLVLLLVAEHPDRSSRRDRRPGYIHDRNSR